MRQPAILADVHHPLVRRLANPAYGDIDVAPDMAGDLGMLAQRHAAFGAGVGGRCNRVRYPA
jgi:hypothetical protein